MNRLLLLSLILAAIALSYLAGRYTANSQHRNHPVDRTARSLESVTGKPPAAIPLSEITDRTPPSDSEELLSTLTDMFVVELDAMSRGDVRSVSEMIVLSEDAKVQLNPNNYRLPDSLSREYYTPELLAAFVFCGAQQIEGYKINSVRSTSSTDASLRITYKFKSESDWRTEDLPYRFSTGRWKRSVEADLAKTVSLIVGHHEEKSLLSPP